MQHAGPTGDGGLSDGDGAHKMDCRDKRATEEICHVWRANVTEARGGGGKPCVPACSDLSMRQVAALKFRIDELVEEKAQILAVCCRRCCYFTPDTLCARAG